MTTISQDWQRLALDDGSVIEEAHEYAVEIVSDIAPTRSVRPTSVRHTSDTNAANNMKVDVPPADFLTGETYLGSTATVYVDGDVLFEGEVKSITVDERGTGDYTLNIYSQGRKLEGGNVDRTTNNEVVYDTIAYLVDRYNNHDSYHDEMVEGNSESLSSSAMREGGGVISSSGGSATVTYSGVGPNASDVELVRAKIFTPTSSSVSIVISTSSNSHSASFSSEDKNMYGEWVSVDPQDVFNGDGESYDIEFQITGDGLLIDWISLTDTTLIRDVKTPDVSVTETDEFLYQYTSAEMEAQGSRQTGTDAQGNAIVNEGVVFDSSLGSDGGWRTRQVASWDTTDSSDFNPNSDSEATNGIAHRANNNGFPLELHDISPIDSLDNWELWARGRVTQSDFDSGDDWEALFEVNGETAEVGFSGFFDTEYQWVSVAEWNFSGNWPESFSSSDSIEVGTQNVSNTVEPLFCSFVMVHRPDNTNPGYSFDNSVDSNQQLLQPHEFAGADAFTNQYVEFSEFVSDENISASETTATMGGTDSPLDVWGPIQRIDIDSFWPEGGTPSSVSKTDDYSYPGVSHQTRVYLTANGSRTDESPTEGFDYMSVTGVSVSADRNDLDVTYDRNISDNRLSAMSSLADESTAYFRFEGDNAVIFQRGLETTSPNLRESSAESTISIEDTYESCEVIGLHNVRSGVIVAEDAPDYVDDHKVIRDQQVETEADAIARAKSFLDENGNVQYQGNIETLPTLAPVGALMDGSNFSHGNDMIVKSVSYDKRRSSITLGLDKDIVDEFIGLNTHTHGTEARETGEGMRIPSGEDASSQ